MELPKTFETFLLAVAGLLFYLAYSHSEKEILFDLGMSLGGILITIAIALYVWRTYSYQKYLDKELEKQL